MTKINFTATPYKIIKLTNGGQTVVDDEDFKKANKFKWYLSDNGYAVRKGYNDPKTKKYTPKILRLHRLIMNTPPEYETDHVNHDKLDNRKSNLRVVTKSQNSFNVGIRKNNTSGYKGVSWSNVGKRWLAMINPGRKAVFLGYFANKEDAAKAYNEAAKKFYGEFGYMNNL